MQKRKLFLFFAHRLTDGQVNEAKNRLSIEEFVYLPEPLQELWDSIPPQQEISEEIMRPFELYIKNNITTNDIMLVQGEYAITYKIVEFAKRHKLDAIMAATNKRHEIEQTSASVETRAAFSHHYFRRYNRYKGFITLLGLQQDINRRVKYTFEPSLHSSYSDKSYEEVNTLSLLMPFHKDSILIPVGTKDAIGAQRGVYEDEVTDPKPSFDPVLLDDSNYQLIFQAISSIIDEGKFEEYVIDLTHGFRHIPIMMMIQLVGTSFANKANIKHILYAKQIADDQYQIIDLLDYIEQGKFLFMIEAFSENYSIFKGATFKNPTLMEIARELGKISDALLAGNIGQLLQDSSVIKGAKQRLIELVQEGAGRSFRGSAFNLIATLDEFNNYLNEELIWKRLYGFALNYYQKGFVLNSITLLAESLSLYCFDKIYNISPRVAMNIDQKLEFEKSKNYKQSQLGSFCFSYGFVKNGYKIDRDIALPDDISNDIRNHIQSLESFKKISKLLDKLKMQRNKLAHGTIDGHIGDVSTTLKKLFEDFEEILDADKTLQNRQKSIQERIDRALRCATQTNVVSKPATTVASTPTVSRPEKKVVLLGKSQEAQDSTKPKQADVVSDEPKTNDNPAKESSLKEEAPIEQNKTQQTKTIQEPTKEKPVEKTISSIEVVDKKEEEELSPKETSLEDKNPPEVKEASKEEVEKLKDLFANR